jgi:ATP synthase, F1 gamma subunit
MAKTNEIKNRIASIDMIGSITNAMYLVSMAKLQKHQKRIETLQEYEKLVKQHMSEIFAAFQYMDEAFTHPFMKKNKNPKNIAYIVFTSSMGLCGSYNENVIRTLTEQLHANPEITPHIFMIGRHGYNKAIHRGLEVFKLLDPQSDVLRYSELREAVTNEVIEGFYNNTYDAIRIIYTKYINPLTQKVTIDQVLPIASMKDLLEDAEISFAPFTIFEPSREEVLDYMVRKNVKSTAYIHYLEAQTSEESIRRMSMDNANKNGKELVEQLKLQYNRERQANITQEMTEIIGGNSTD